MILALIPTNMGVWLNRIIKMVFPFFSEHILGISFILDFMLNDIRIMKKYSKCTLSKESKIKSPSYIHIFQCLRNFLNKTIEKMMGFAVESTSP